MSDTNTENLFTPDCIRTFSGHYLDVFNPDPAKIVIEDIAHALAHTPRFGGHLPEFYSVAQHSVMCCEGVDDEFKLQALLHDGSEYALLDIPSPIKKRLTNYKEIEDGLMRCIAKKYGFTYPLQCPVKQIDAIMLQREWDCLMLGKQIDQPLEYWTCKFAKAKFLSAFHALTGTK